MARSAQGAGSIRKKTVTQGEKTYSYWEARITVGYDPGTGKRIRRSFSGNTQREVRQKMQAALAAIDQKTYTAPSKMTVGEWLDTWVAEYLNSVKPFTRASYIGHVENHIKPALGAIKLETLDTDAVQRFCNRLSKPKADGKPGLAPKTVKNVHGVLHKALQRAVTSKHIRFNPADGIDLPLITKKELVPLDEVQSNAFLQGIQGHRFETLFTVTLFTGLREGEALGLEWSRVDFDKGTILINKQLQREKKKGGQYIFAPLKNDKARTITPAPWVMKLLKSHRAKQAAQHLKAGAAWEDSGLVFADELGRHLAIHTVYKDFKAVAAAIGRPDARFHDLRHSYAVAAIRSGDDIKTVQGNLGHATASFTLDVYGHVTDQMKAASAARMENYIENILGQKASG